MSSAVVTRLESALAAFVDPFSQHTLGDLGAVQQLDCDANGGVKVALKFGYPVDRIKSELIDLVCAGLQGIEGVQSVSVDIAWAVAPVMRHQELPGLESVKHIVAVASGKGGVGKSTTTVNLALALAAEGVKVGILDADIYGPSVPQMLGASGQRPAVTGQSMQPVASLGVQSNSMGYLVTENTPMVWRGPMASGALQQLLTQTQWQDLDYLFVDMPPGTGDIQLTLSQKIPVTGAVIVTTPQDIALLDAKKAVEMFRKVNVPILGVVENMATHICSNCGHEEHIFGAGGGERIAREYQTVLLGSLPLDLSIQRNADCGKPSVYSEPDSAIGKTYQHIAAQVGALLALAKNNNGPAIEMGD